MHMYVHKLNLRFKVLSISPFSYELSIPSKFCHCFVILLLFCHFVIILLKRILMHSNILIHKDVKFF